MLGFLQRLLLRRIEGLLLGLVSHLLAGRFLQSLGELLLVLERRNAVLLLRGDQGLAGVVVMVYVRLKTVQHLDDFRLGEVQ